MDQQGCLQLSLRPVKQGVHSGFVWVDSQHRNFHNDLRMHGAPFCPVYDYVGITDLNKDYV